MKTLYVKLSFVRIWNTQPPDKGAAIFYGPDPFLGKIAIPKYKDVLNPTLNPPRFELVEVRVERVTFDPPNSPEQERPTSAHMPVQVWHGFSAPDDYVIPPEYVDPGETLLPNLVDSITSVDETTVKPGKALGIVHTLKNSGKASIESQKFATYLSRDQTVTTDDLFLGEFTTGRLQAGGEEHWKTFTLPLPADLAPGIYYVAQIADYNKSISESDEGDNVSNVVKITVTSGSATGPLFTDERNQVDFTDMSAKKKKSVQAAPDAIYDALGGADEVRLPDDTKSLVAGIRWDPSRQFRAGDGGDMIFGGALADHIDGGEGIDFIYGGRGANYLYGGSGEYTDFINGFPDRAPQETDSRNVMFGGAGDDHIQGSGGGDLLIGGSGKDVLRGGGGKDTLIAFDPTLAFAVDDAIENEHLSGGAGDDVFVASNGTVIEQVEGLDQVFIRKSPDFLAALIVKHTTGWKIIQLDGVAIRDKPFDVAFKTLSVVTIADFHGKGIPGISGGNVDITTASRPIAVELGKVVGGKDAGAAVLQDRTMLSLGVSSGSSTGAPTVEAQLQAAAALAKYRDAVNQIGEKLLENALGLAGKALTDKLKQYSKFVGADAAAAAKKQSPLDLLPDDVSKLARDAVDLDAFQAALFEIGQNITGNADYDGSKLAIDISKAVLKLFKKSWIGTGLDIASPWIDAFIKDVLDLLTIHVDEKLDRILQGVGGPGSETIDQSYANDAMIYFTAGGDDVVRDGTGDSLFIAANGLGDDLYDGGGGADTVAYESARGRLSIDLRAGKASGAEVGNDVLVSIENATGGGGSDTIVGNAAANLLSGLKGHDRLDGLDGKDTLVGGGGGDTLAGGSGGDVLQGGTGRDSLIGGRGADRLEGGGGADMFVFRVVGDSTVATIGRDTIVDYSSRQKDRIDLSGIDAKAGTRKDHKFKFIGDDPFSKEKGELRFEQNKKKTIVYGDVNGDGRADFAIEIAKSVALEKSDFIL